MTEGQLAKAKRKAPYIYLQIYIILSYGESRVKGVGRKHVLGIRINSLISYYWRRWEWFQNRVHPSAHSLAPTECTKIPKVPTYPLSYFLAIKTENPLLDLFISRESARASSWWKQFQFISQLWIFGSFGLNARKAIKRFSTLELGDSRALFVNALCRSIRL